MNNSKKLVKLSLFSPIFLPTFAYGHSESAAGFFSGFSHPFFGMDHFLAMLSVGFISARIDGHYVWSIPTLFVLFMLIGGAIGVYGIELPMVEWGIALSVSALGIAITFVNKVNPLLLVFIMAFVAFFGTLHGYAHGNEMPNSISPIFYTIGFMTSTSTIHLVGVYIGYLPGKNERLKKMPPYVGCTITIAGCFILYGLSQG